MVMMAFNSKDCQTLKEKMTSFVLVTLRFNLYLGSHYKYIDNFD